MAVICCSADDTMEECKERYKDHTIPNWPDLIDRKKRPFGWIHCSDIPGMLKKSWPSAASAQTESCKDCDCKESKIVYRCDKKMSKCTAQLLKDKKIAVDPCKTTFVRDCKTGNGSQLPNNSPPIE
ncbi:hypothetical protein Q31a_13940 [Aureliella helgolandensis]|uniref:Uncharacterized protein n=1 Tax=Aureliella helgolandensis TaxID=2527968 RepID=A0A518G3I1_9BACT|nr:hypothetical protein Q31a_13940 [Aureliella helgolandensis]